MWNKIRHTGFCAWITTARVHSQISTWVEPRLSAQWTDTTVVCFIVFKSWGKNQISSSILFVSVRELACNWAHNAFNDKWSDCVWREFRIKSNLLNIFVEYHHKNQQSFSVWIQDWFIFLDRQHSCHFWLEMTSSDNISSAQEKGLKGFFVSS